MKSAEKIQGADKMTMTLKLHNFFSFITFKTAKVDVIGDVSSTDLCFLAKRLFWQKLIGYFLLTKYEYKQ